MSATRSPARCPGPSIQDIVRQDGDRPVSALAEAPFVDMGDADIAFERYTSPAFAALEMDRMWRRVWQMACRLEHIPAPGDYHVHDVGARSLVIVRTESMQVRAYYNACLHRGTKLKASASDGWSRDISCPYHGWTWSLDGRLTELPCEWDFAHVDRAKFDLPEARVATWGGFVFVCMDETAPPLETYLGVMPAHFERWDLSQRYVALHVEKIVPCNWKAASEAFMEAYHVARTHPQMVLGAADVNIQCDIFDDHVSRYYSAIGVPSPALASRPSEQEILESMFMADASSKASQPKLGEGVTARATMARMVRAAIEAESGRDLAGFATTEVVDVIGYGLFPNTVFFAGLATSMVYRFRPVKGRTDRAIFDLYLLKLRPEGAQIEAPAPIRLGKDDRYCDVAELDPALARVFDQDLGNMRMQQEGFEATYKPGATLSRYQELRIRQLHATLDRYLSQG